MINVLDLIHIPMNSSMEAVPDEPIELSNEELMQMDKVEQKRRVLQNQEIESKLGKFALEDAREVSAKMAQTLRNELLGIANGPGSTQQKNELAKKRLGQYDDFMREMQNSSDPTMTNVPQECEIAREAILAGSVGYLRSGVGERDAAPEHSENAENLMQLLAKTLKKKCE